MTTTLSIVLTIFIFSIASTLTMGKYVNYLDIIKFDLPCPKEDYKYDHYTGYFMCAVPSGDECRSACNKQECYEWYIDNQPSPFEKEVTSDYRCRCLPEISMCFYNPIPKSQQNYYEWTYKHVTKRRR